MTTYQYHAQAAAKLCQVAAQLSKLCNPRLDRKPTDKVAERNTISHEWPVRRAMPATACASRHHLKPSVQRFSFERSWVDAQHCS
jgi:hypothetical protein